MAGTLAKDDVMKEPGCLSLDMMVPTTGYGLQNHAEERLPASNLMSVHDLAGVDVQTDGVVGT